VEAVRHGDDGDARQHRRVLRRARDLPETMLRAASLRLTMQSFTAVLTSAVVWGCEVSQGVVNLPRIDGKDGVAGSIPAGGSR
jgi:hypothetical protein